MKTHDVKVHARWYGSLLSGDKTFEVRKDDRGYRVGDVLHVKEWDPDAGPFTGAVGQHTGRSARFKITYILDRAEFNFGQGDYVVLGLLRCDEEGNPFVPVVEISVPKGVIAEVTSEE